MNLRNRRLPPIVSKPKPKSSIPTKLIKSIKPKIYSASNSSSRVSLHLESVNVFSPLEMNQEDQEGIHNGGLHDEHKINEPVHVPPLDPNNMLAFMAAMINANQKLIGKEPTYNGSSTDILPEDYIAKLNNYARVNGLTEQRKLGLAGVQLSGVAETWFNDIPENAGEKQNWNTFCESLIRRFTVPNADMNHFRIFQSRKQKKHETVEEYGEDLKKLIKNIRNKTLVPEAIQITTFINGLSPTLRRTMDFQGVMPNSLVEAILVAKRIETANNVFFESTKDNGNNMNRTEQDNNKKRRSDHPVVVAQIVKPQGGESTGASATANTGTQRPQRDMSSIVCNRCKTAGHFASSCPTLKDVLCFKCQRNGHFASRCPNEKVVVKEERKGDIRAISTDASRLKQYNSATGGDFVTIAHIADVRTAIVCDSGAGSHCMSSSFYDRMDKVLYPLTPSTLVMTNANGEQMNVLGVAKIPIDFDDCPGKTEIWNFHVISNLTDNVLVGKGDIEQVTLTNGMVIKKGTNLVRTAQAVTVPAQTVRMINIVSELAAEADQILEPKGNTVGLIARCLVTPGSQQHVTNIVNTGVYPIHIKAAEVVGEIEDAVVVADNDEINVDSGMKHLHGISKESDELNVASVCTVKTDIGITDEEIEAQIDKRLAAEQRQKMKDLLIKYRNVFSTNPKGPGLVTHVEHVIDTGDTRPIKQRSYRTSQKEDQYLKQEVEEMIDNGIIRPSASPWSSPVVLVGKKDGSLRFCIDYRKLNEATKKDSYPIPRIQDTLDTLNGSKFFSSLDFAAGYWQIRVNEPDIPKTAFVTKSGLYEFIRMPFGLCNAPSTFQRAMDVLLAGLNWKTALIYIDDILVYSRTFNDHLADLEAVLIRLSDAKFTVKLSKCFFGREEVSYLGHLVGSQGVKPDPNKIKAVEQFPVPTNLTEVRSFLRLTTYYHRFVPSYATIAEPLYYLQKKNVHFSWTESCQKAFEQIKQLLISSPTLRFPNFEREFIVMCDASNVGVGSILSQIDDDKNEYVISYASRALSAEERNYSTTEKECLAVLFSIKTFRPYLHGTFFTIVTDHGSLTWLMNLRDANGRLARWSLQLQGYTFTIRHRPGREHANADALSRCPIRLIGTGIEIVPVRAVTTRTKARGKLDNADHEIKLNDNSLNNNADNLTIVNGDSHEFKLNSNDIQVVTDDTDESKVEQMNLNEIEQSMDLFRRKQLEDVEYSDIILYLKNKTLPSDVTVASRIRVQASSYMIVDDLLYHIWTPTNTSQRLDVRKQLVVPSSLRQDIMIQNHDSYAGGHFGSHKTFMKIRDRYFWNTMYQDVESYCKSCLVCQRRKVPRRQMEAALMSTPIPNYPFERIGVDAVGPLPETLSGNKYIIVFTDSFTRWTEAFAVPEQKEETVAQLLVEEIVCRFGAPKYLVSDRGANFLSNLCNKIYELLKINKVTTTSYHPQSNGIVERFNGVLVEMLSMFSSESDWDAYIPYLLSAYRSCYNSTLQETPYYMVFGRQMVLPVDAMLNVGAAYYTDRSDYADECAYRLNEAHERVKLHLQKIVDEREQKNVELNNQKEFRVGDWVWLRSVPAANVNQKLNENKFKGPYQVLERTSLVNYKLDIPTAANGKTPHNIVHVDRLKKYYNPETTSAAVSARRH